MIFENPQFYFDTLMLCSNIHILIILKKLIRTYISISLKCKIFMKNMRVMIHDFIRYLWINESTPPQDHNLSILLMYRYITGPDSKVHGANIGPTWVLSAPDEPHVVPMNLAIRGGLLSALSLLYRTVCRFRDNWWLVILTVLAMV